MVYIGPVIVGFIIGFIIGTRIKPNIGSNLKFPVSVYVLLAIVIILIAYQQGPFPWYTDSIFANGLMSAFLGIVVGKLTFGRS